MTRREIREHIFLMLFRKEFHKAEELNEQMELYISEIKEPTVEEYSYLTNRFQKVLDNLESIDQILSEAVSGWKLHRMGKVELAILRLAVYELCFDEEIPDKVAINEAIEMGKIFGGDEAPGFINGVLAKVVQGKKSQSN